LLIAIAAAKDWYLDQLDVNNAFLHGELNEEVYMCLPQGLYTEKPNQVCRLMKSLYGLKQASRQWYAKLTNFLHSIGFIQSAFDHSLFSKKTASSFTVLLVYVDDILLAGKDHEHINEVKQILNSSFKIKDIGQLSFFLGFEVSRTKEGIHMNQRKYALDILANRGMLAAKPCFTPMVKDIKLMFEQNDPIQEEESYRRIVGRLLYLTNTRPNIKFSVHLLSQFMQSLNTHHHKAINQILRYIKGSPTRGIFFPSKSNMQLQAFSDSDWASCNLTRRSTTGYCIYIGASLISWKTKKQSTVSRSSSEAEYRALATTVYELQWLTYILQDLQISIDKTANLFCDNEAARHIASNLVFHERTKHIDIHCHVVRERLQAGLFHLLPIQSTQQPADIFTKPLEHV